MKPNNKLGKLQFDPVKAFETFRTKSKKVLSISKRDLGDKLNGETLKPAPQQQSDSQDDS